MTIVTERLDAAEIVADVVSDPDSGEIVIRLDEDEPAAVERATELATRRGVVELYDLERSLVSPSITDGQIVAYRRLYELLVGRQSRVRADDVEQWYLFDTEGNVAGGPAPTKELLTPGGEPLPGWRALGVPPERVVLECGGGVTICPGVGTAADAYYLAEAAPALTAEDIVAGSARQDFDVTTGEPIVTLGFTAAGQARFEQVTAAAAERGRSLSEHMEPWESFQHIAIVVDRRVLSWPTIDWQQYPNGIDAGNGMQITGIGSLEEARNLALAVRTGELPVELELVSEPPESG